MSAMADVVDGLNRMLEIDRDAVSRLFGVMVPCGERMGAEWTGDLVLRAGPEWFLTGVLGVLNGALKEDAEQIVVIMDGGTVTRFEVRAII